MANKPYYLNEEVTLDMIITASKAIPIMREYSHLMSQLIRINDSKDSAGHNLTLLEKEISNELSKNKADDDKVLRLIRQEGHTENSYHRLDREREYIIGELQKSKMHLVLLNHEGIKEQYDGKVNIIPTHPSIQKHVVHFLHLHKNSINDEINKSEFKNNVTEHDLIQSLEQYFNEF